MADIDHNTENLTLRLLREMREEQKQTRRETQRIAENMSGLARLISQLREELTTTLRIEIDGSLAHFETRVEQLIAREIAERN